MNTIVPFSGVEPAIDAIGGTDATIPNGAGVRSLGSREGEAVEAPESNAADDAGEVSCGPMEAMSETKGRLSVDRTCRRCGTCFIALQYEVNRGGGQFCSLFCQRRYARCQPRRKKDPYACVMRGATREGDCLIFARCKNNDGYGVACGQLAHRIVWAHWHPESPSPEVVMHTCDNPPCIEISHLRAGTRPENSADMRFKGRQAHQYGERGGRAKLTSDQVAEIRRRALLGESPVVLSREYGMNRGYTASLIRGHHRKFDGDMELTFRQKLESAISKIENGECSIEDIADAHQKLEAYIEIGKALKQEFEQRLIRWITINGPVEYVINGEGAKKIFSLGHKRDTKCIDVKATVEALVEYSAGDWDAFVTCLSSNALKPGACRKVLPPEVWAQHFKVTVKDKLVDGSPAPKELQVIDTRWIGK